MDLGTLALLPHGTAGERGPDRLPPHGYAGDRGISRAEGWRGGEVSIGGRSEHDGGPQRQDPAARTGTARSSPTGYSPLDTLRPRFWLPWVGYSPASGTLVGFVTGGQDALQRHRYTLTALYGPESGRLMHSLDYAYDGLRPTLRLISSDYDRTYAGLLQDAAAAPTTPSAAARRRRRQPDFPGFDSSQAFTLGYRYRELSALAPLPPRTVRRGQPATGRSAPRGSAGPSPTPSGSRSRSAPRRGGGSTFRLERYQDGFGSDLSFTRASLDWSEYLALPPPRHVLAARLFLGGASGGPPQQGVFSLGGDAPGDDHALDDRACSCAATRPTPSAARTRSSRSSSTVSRCWSSAAAASRPLLPAPPPRGALRGRRRGLETAACRADGCTRGSAPRSVSTSSSPTSCP